MKKYPLLFFILITGCSNVSKVRHFSCVTPVGIVTLDSDNPQLKIKPGSLILEQDNNTVIIPRGLCVEVIDK